MLTSLIFLLFCHFEPLNPSTSLSFRACREIPLCPLGASLNLSLFSPPGISFEPGFNWFTMETEHFSVHFPCQGALTQERLDFITEVAQTAEEVRETFLTNGVLVPRTKTQLVIADYYDYYNGYATPFPEPTIVIFPFPPGPDESNTDNWLRALLIHEYSHITQLDQTAGIPLLLRRIFGNIILPNALLPAWLIEGYAVYNETRFTNFGRARSPEYRSVLLTSATNRQLLSLDRCAIYDLQRFPSSTSPYLYGSAFVSFIAAQKGDSMWELFNRQNSRQLPFLENLTASKILSANFPCFYKEYQDSLTQSADSLISLCPPSFLIKITSEGFNTSSPCWSRTGRRLYYISSSGKEPRSIKTYDLGTNTVTTIHRGKVFGNLSISPDNNLLAFTEMRVKEKGFYQSDIFLYDLTRRTQRQITFGQRASDPDFAPDSATITYVTNDSAMSRLILLNYQTNERMVIAEQTAPNYYHSPRFSPEGGLIAVGVWREPGYADIEIIDIKNGWLIPITQDRACDLFPFWSRTGKVLFFVSDRSGIYNLYAYAIETQKLYQCTNLLSGVFQPAVAPDNKKIALTTLGPDGYDINLIDYLLENWQLAAEFIDNYPRIDFPVGPDVRSAEVYHYNPFPTLLPKFWLPWITLDSVPSFGVITLGWDVLRFHRYQATATYNYQKKTPQLNLFYELHRFRPIFSFAASWTIKTQKTRLGLELPFYQTNASHSITIGTTLAFPPSAIFDPRSSFPTSTLFYDASYQFTNARKFRFCVAPVQGRNFGISAIPESKRLLSRFNRLRLLLYLKEFLGMPPATWSLSPRLTIGMSYGDSSRFNSFALTNQDGIFLVRGYPDSSITGANTLTAGLEFRIPLLWVEHGLAQTPIFLSNINGALFSDAGLIADTIKNGIKQWRAGAGAELSLDFILAHYVPIRFTAGLAFGLKQPPTHQFYLQIKSELLSSILNRPFSPLRLNAE